MKKRILAIILAFIMCTPNAFANDNEAKTIAENAEDADRVCITADSETVKYEDFGSLKGDVHLEQSITINADNAKSPGALFRVVSENRKTGGKVDRKLELIKIADEWICDGRQNKIYQLKNGETAKVDITIDTETGRYSFDINGEQKKSGQLSYNIKFTKNALKNHGISGYEILPYKPDNSKKNGAGGGTVYVDDVNIYSIGELAGEYDTGFSEDDLKQIKLKFNNKIPEESLVSDYFTIEDNKITDIKADDDGYSCVITLENPLEYKKSYIFNVAEGFKDIYGGTIKTVAVNTPDVPVSARLRDMVVINISCRNVLSYGKKCVFDETKPNLIPLDEYGNVMIPARAFLNILGVTTTETDTGFSCTLNNDLLEFIPASEFYLKNGNKVMLKSKTSASCDEVLVSVEDITSLLKMKAEMFDDGLVIISEKGSGFDAKRDSKILEEIRDLLIYKKTSREEILNDYIETSAGKHPRVLVPDYDVFETLKTSLDDDETLSQWYNQLIARADNVVSGNHPVYDLPNNLTQIQELRKFRQRAELLGMAYNITGDEKYAAYLYEETKIAAAVSTDWRTIGYLNAGTLLMGLGISYDWLYNYMTEEQRDVLRAEIIERHIMPGLEAHRGTLVPPSRSWTDVMNTVGWVTWNSNWNIICNSGMMVMASAMIEDEPELSTEIMEYGLESLKYYTPEFYPDGAALESLGYLTVILSDFGRLISTLEKTFGTSYGLLDAPGISQMPYVIAYLTGHTAINNFGDSAESLSVQPAETMMYAHMLKDSDLAQLRINEVDLGKSILETMDFIWYDTTMEKGATTLDNDRYFRIGETGSMRGSWDDSGSLFMSYHAGDNAINHSHMDTGTFVLDALGERWAIDLGSDSLSYSLNPQSGVTSRWQLYYLRTEGHNTITINPDYEPGQVLTAFSPVTRFESKEGSTYSIIDMTEAYAEDASKVHRGYMLHQNRRVATVRDEIDLISPGDVYWFMHTKADIEISEDGKEAYLTQNGKKLYAKLESNQNLKFTVMDAVPFETSPKLNYQASTEGIKKLAVFAPSVMKFEISVSFTPLYSTGEKMAEIPKISRLDKWKLKSTEIPLPYIEAITVNGENLEQFAKNLYTYNIELPFDAKDIPQVEASGDKEITVKQPEAFNSESIITVRDTVNKTLNQYSLNFFIKNIIGEPENATVIMPVASEALGTLDPPNPKENAFDGDLNTRFSIGGLGDSLIVDFGEQKTIDCIGMSFYLGDQRQASYEIYVSDDKESWTKIVPKTSTSGTTAGIETMRINPTTTRYIKIGCHGTSTGVWFSPTEIRFYSLNN